MSTSVRLKTRWLLIQFSFVGMKYLIFSFSHCDDAAKYGVEIRYSANALRIRRKQGNGGVLMENGRPNLRNYCTTALFPPRSVFF